MNRYMAEGILCNCLEVEATIPATILKYTTRGYHTITQNMYTTSTYATSIVALLDNYNLDK